VARPFYERLLIQFPNAGRFWKAYIEHEVGGDDLPTYVAYHSPFESDHCRTVWRWEQPLSRGPAASILVAKFIQFDLVSVPVEFVPILFSQSQLDQIIR